MKYGRKNRRHYEEKYQNSAVGRIERVKLRHQIFEKNMIMFL